jgi:hypothetical protein
MDEISWPAPRLYPVEHEKGPRALSPEKLHTPHDHDQGLAGLISFAFHF